MIVLYAGSVNGGQPLDRPMFQKNHGIPLRMLELTWKGQHPISFRDNKALNPWLKVWISEQVLAVVWARVNDVLESTWGDFWLELWVLAKQPSMSQTSRLTLPVKYGLVIGQDNMHCELKTFGLGSLGLRSRAKCQAR